MANWFFRLRDWQEDDANNIGITSPNHDEEDDNFAVGINGSLSISGLNSPTANIPMGGFKFTGAANGSAASDFATISQAQSRTVAYAVDSAGVDSYVIALSPAITSYAAGQIFNFAPGTANTGAATININGLGAKTIKKDKDTDLTDGDLIANQIVSIAYDGTNFQMLSPPRGLINQSGSAIYAADGGGSDSYSITLAPALASYSQGLVLYFKANTGNTDAASLNVNSLGAKTIKKSQGADLATNDIKANQIVQVIYDGTNFQMLSPVYGEVGQNGASIYAADAGSNDTYVITLIPTPVAYSEGMHVYFKANTLNTGACTLNINSLGAKTIKKFGTTRDLATGDILAGQHVHVIYDGTNFQMISAVDDIDNLTADTTPDGTADYIKTWDASAATYKKALINNIFVAATQADQETGTSTTTFVSPGRQKYHQSAAKAWVTFNGTGTIAIQESYNVTSITDNGTGDTTITFTTSFSNTTYSLASAVFGPGSSGLGAISLQASNSRATGSCRVLSGNNSLAVSDCAVNSVVFFGDQ